MSNKTWLTLSKLQPSVGNPWPRQQQSRGQHGGACNYFPGGNGGEEPTDTNARNGSLPSSELSVKWKYFEALLASIVAIDLLVVALSFHLLKSTP